VTADESHDLEEVESGKVEGSGEDQGKEPEHGFQVKYIVSYVPRVKRAEATKENTTLDTVKFLADSLAEGYYWKEGLLFRTHLDKLGDAREQLCSSKPYREKCLQTSPEQFGHLERNKLSDQIRQFFYWLTITADAMRHIKTCEKCQKMDKTLPRKMYMQERELTTIPSERVAIDLAGPFPTAKGGFKYLLTYIDLATRWPEAIPLRRTTAAILIE